MPNRSMSDITSDTAAAIVAHGIALNALHAAHTHLEELLAEGNATQFADAASWSVIYNTGQCAIAASTSTQRVPILHDYPSPPRSVP